MNAAKYCLFFSQHGDRDKGLDYGRLQLIKFNDFSEVWKATSSISSKQYLKSIHKRGGLIPQAYRCSPKFPHWTVKTKPLWLPKVKGVEGNFYKINPHFVTTDKGGQRGDFGIHLDANMPGSLGCIVMTSNRFKEFCKYMERVRKDGVKEIPLVVQYS